jgi:hypothetical protein
VEALRLIVLVVVAGCGRIDFDPRAHDAGDANGPDAACLGTGTFTNVQPVTALNDSDTQYGTSLSPDGLVLLWDQSNGTFDELHMAQRSSRADGFTAGALVPGISFAGNASDPSITGDLLELYFASDVTAGLCIYRATRTSTAQPFDAPVKLDALCNGITTTGPSTSADGLTLVYSSALDGLAEGDLYITVRGDRTADFPAGKKLNGLPTGVGYPWLSEDRLRIWFEEEIGPDLEIATARRISPSDDFSGLQGLAELDTGTGNGDPGLTADESEIVFASSRTGNYDIYLAERPCL